MEGFANTSTLYKTDLIIPVVSGIVNHQDKKDKPGTSAKFARKKAVKRMFSQELEESLNIHTNGYGPDANKTEFNYDVSRIRISERL